MCGFLGIYAPPQQPLQREKEAYFRSRAKNLAHRGNSGEGSEFHDRYALFHYRLAFRDLADGKQPLQDKKKRATILFNGELYNFRPLRDELKEGYDFQTKSDTEVILAGYLKYGAEVVHQIDGEYAFVIFDHRTGQVFAARDPFGVKPLFWGNGDSSPAPQLREFRDQYHFSLNGQLQFASEIKGLAFPVRWDTRGHRRCMLSLYEEMGTSFEGIFSLAPGATFLASPENAGWKISIQRNISFDRKKDSFSKTSFEDRSKELKDIIAENVQWKLDSDVPLGAYLSGGIDSRIAAFEMGKTQGKIETFTVGFEHPDYDETPEVKAFLTSHKNLQGRALKTTAAALEYSYPHAIYASELVQPYTNGGAKWWLSKFARRYVRGVLTGDGSDELFCGYPSYRYLAWWKFYQRSPGAFRSELFSKRVVGTKEKFWEKGLSSYPDGSDLQESIQTFGWAHPLFAQIQSLAQLHFGSGKGDYFQSERDAILSYLQLDSKDSSSKKGPSKNHPSKNVKESPLTQWQNYFLRTHFPTHVLNWVGDRMEMANTLEGRPIFLSKKIGNFCRQSPDHHLVRGMKDKAILRKAYADSLGKFSRTPKKQFNAPFQIDGKLAKEYLSDAFVQEAGVLDSSKIAMAKSLLQSQDPLQKSFAQIYLQNCLVTQMLHRFFVLDQAPERDSNFEETFLDQHTVNL